MDKGAHFHKCDFQVHTPRDLNWHGNPAVTEDDRKKYSKLFIKQCREKNLDAIAITDHHDFAFFSYIKYAAENETDLEGNRLAAEKRIIVFPGLEMTFSNPASCQSILILNADFPVENFHLILSKLSIVPNPPSESKTIQTLPISVDVIRDLTDLHAKLDSLEVLKGKYIVLPNVGEGHGSVMRRGFYEHYIKMPCVGGYVDGAMPTSVGYSNKVNGLDNNYSHKSIGVFQTSDNRREDGLHLGTYSTWIKWAEPTSEAIRQACLSKESRISLVEPELPQLHIRSIDITASRYLGIINIAFNAQFNALIGGRGTGKSTILEYLRWGLCDQPMHSLDEEDLTSIERKRRNLIDKTLAEVNGEVRITFDLNQVQHIIKRKAGSREILLKIGSGEFQSVTEGEIRRLLPVQAYSQKQLSDVGIRNEELKRLIKQPILQSLDALSSELQDVSKYLKDAYTRLTNKREIEKDIANLTRELESLKGQVSAYRNGLKNLPNEVKEIISNKSIYETEQAIVDNLNMDLNLLKEKVGDIDSFFQRYRLSKSDYPSVLNVDVIDKMRTVVDEMYSQIQDKVVEINTFVSEGTLEPYVKLHDDWLNKRDAFNIEYSEAQKSTRTSEEQLNEIKKREDRLSIVEHMLSKKVSDLKQAGNPEPNFETQKQRWLACHRRKLSLLVRETDSFTALSDGLIKAEVLTNIDTKNLREILKSIFEGTRIREDRIIAILQFIKANADSLAAYQTFIEEIKSLAEHSLVDGSSTTLPPTLILTACGFNEDHILKLCNKVSFDDYLRLATLELDYTPEFFYRTNTQMDDMIPFADASAGQQATALLSVLLNQGGAPLIIDQPEDDIDNRAIDDIIKKIWKAKSKRQLIFASHNANLVVNGDAELVICFAYREAADQTNGEIKCLGAIDNMEVRNEITSVMEGGEKAFRLRKAKYGF